MPNNLENNGIVEEKIYYNAENIHGEMMRYRNNSLSYKLGMLAILFSILAAFISLNSVKWNYLVIVKILMNVVILLFGFLSIEKAKAYSKKFSYVLIGMGVLCIIRIFWWPLLLIKDYATYLNDNTQVGILGPTITGNYLANSFLWMSGYFRGITAIVLLAIAAAGFLAAGIIGYIKAKEYSDFMDTQDITKGV